MYVFDQKQNTHSKEDGAMVRHASLFSQLIGLFSRRTFYGLVFRHGSERYSKGFSSWDHFVAMLFCQLAQAKSLREICGGLACCMGKLRHLGLKAAPNKSTLSYANAHRSWQMFRDFFYETLEFCKKTAPARHKFRFKNKLLTLDATTISLCLSLFPWAKFRTTKGAVKLHAMIDLKGNLPAFATITDGKVHDVKAAPLVPIEPEGIYVADRAYIDFDWLWSIDQKNAYFVTRLKRSIKWTRVISHPVDKSVGLRSDQEILLFAKKTNEKYPKRLRRISFRDELQARTLVFLTNNFLLPADTIAALYKARWEIELFFKWIKQNLKVKSFFGTSANAVKIQIWIAMIVYLILAIIRERYRLESSLSQLLHFLEVNLFEQKSLVSIFSMNSRRMPTRSLGNDNQLKLFDY